MGVLGQHGVPPPEGAFRSGSCAGSPRPWYRVLLGFTFVGRGFRRRVSDKALKALRRTVKGEEGSPFQVTQRSGAPRLTVSF